MNSTVATATAEPTPRRDRRLARASSVLIALSMAATAIVLAALATGAVPIAFSDLIADRDGSGLARTVFVEIRSPRVVLAGFVGAALALAGAALQGLFRNPLADPGLIGVSSGAALGAIAMIVLGAGLAVSATWTPFLIPGAAVAGAGAVTLFLYAFARRYGRFSIVTMLLVGIAVNALAVVGIGAFQYLSDDTQLRMLTFWMLGSFGRATWPTVLPALALIGISGWVLMLQARALDLLQLGEPEARHLGVDVGALKRRIIIATATTVGAGVALSGIISFVGLVVPHLVRLLGGVPHRYVLPASALLGAGLMVFADLVARMIIVPAEMPVGLVTSGLGAPFFLWLIARVRPQ